MGDFININNMYSLIKINTTIVFFKNVHMQWTEFWFSIEIIFCKTKSLRSFYNDNFI